MAIDIGTIGIEIHATTSTGGPIILAEGVVTIPASAVPSGDGVIVTVHESSIRHEIAGMLISVARQLEDRSGE